MYYYIQVIHLLLILICLFSVIIPFQNIKIYSLTFLIFLLFHYTTNFNKCGLTELEYLFSNKKYEEGFIYRIVKPILSIPEDYFNYYLYLIHIIWIIILFYQIRYN